MSTYYKSQDIDPFEFLPITFHVTSTKCDEFDDYLKLYTAPSEKESIWIVKPGEDTNRGRGIAVFSDISSIR